MKREKKERSTRSPGNFKWVTWVLIGILLVIFVVVYWQWSMRSALAKRPWRTNILVRSTTPTIISLPTSSTDKVLVFVLSKDVETQVPYGYGRYRLEALTKLGELENYPILDAETIEDMLGIRLRAIVDVQGEVEVEDVLGSLKRIFTFTNKVTWTKPNYFAAVDAALLRTKLMLLSSTDTLVFDLRNDAYLFPVKTQLDQTKLLTVNQQPLDEFVESKFTQEQVRVENVTISVHNTTDTAGTGNKFSRYISNFGGKILGVENDTAFVSHCEIRVSQNHEKSVVVEYLKQEFSCTTTDKWESDVAEIVVLVGESFAKRWN